MTNCGTTFVADMPSSRRVLRRWVLKRWLVLSKPSKPLTTFATPTIHIKNTTLDHSRPTATPSTFKIDYFDRTMTVHSPNPADPTVTERVITIMLAAEY